MAPSISTTLVVAELAVRERLSGTVRAVCRAVAGVLATLVTLVELLFVSVVLRLADFRERARNR